jgi:hypothetical protein
MKGPYMELQNPHFSWSGMLSAAICFFVMQRVVPDSRGLGSPTRTEGGAGNGGEDEQQSSGIPIPFVAQETLAPAPPGPLCSPQAVDYPQVAREEMHELHEHPPAVHLRGKTGAEEWDKVHACHGGLQHFSPLGPAGPDQCVSQTIRLLQSQHLCPAHFS